MLLNIFLTAENILQEKRLLEKAAIIKRFQYSHLDKKLKVQTGIAKDQYQGFDKFYAFNKTVANDKRNNSDNINFNKFNISDEEFFELSTDTTCKHLMLVFHQKK